MTLPPRATQGAAPTIALVGGGNFVGGREIMMLTLARGLRSTGYRVVFISSLWSGKGEFIARLDAEKFEYFRVRLGFLAVSGGWKPFVWTMTQLAYWPALICGYRDAVKASAPQIVIHTNWHHALLLLPILDHHRDLYWSHEIVGDSRHYRWIFRTIAERVARVVCVSRAVAEAWKRLGAPSAKLMVIHNGTMIGKDITPPRAQLPLRLGMVGQIEAWKGHEDLLDALAQLPRDCAVLRIFGAGQSGYVDTLKSKAQTLGIGDRIDWRGFVANLAHIYSEIDVCVVPSRFDDPFPTVALEAALAGRPVICSSRGGLTEIVEDGKTGFVVDAERPDQLAAAINDLAQNPSLIAKMGAAARRRAETEFSQSRFLGDFIGAIGEVSSR